MPQRLLEAAQGALGSSGPVALRRSGCARARLAARPPGPRGSWARRRRPRAFLAREKSAAGALREQLAARGPLGAPRAGGGAWPGRRRAPSHWPFVLQLCPTLGGPRPPRAVAPGKFASPAGPGGLRAPPLVSGNSAARGSLAVASPKEGDSARAIRERRGRVSARRPRAGGRTLQVSEETGVPGTLAARQRRAGSGSRSPLDLSPLGTG